MPSAGKTGSDCSCCLRARRIARSCVPRWKRCSGAHLQGCRPTAAWSASIDWVRREGHLLVVRSRFGSRATRSFHATTSGGYDSVRHSLSAWQSLCAHARGRARRRLEEPPPTDSAEQSAPHSTHPRAEAAVPSGVSRAADSVEAPLAARDPAEAAVVVGASHRRHCCHCNKCIDVGRNSSSRGNKW